MHPRAHKVVRRESPGSPKPNTPLSLPSHLFQEAPHLCSLTLLPRLPPLPPRSHGEALLRTSVGLWANRFILIHLLPRLSSQALRNDPEIQILLTSSNPTVLPKVSTVRRKPRKYLLSPPNLQVPGQGLTTPKGAPGACLDHVDEPPTRQ